MMSSHRRADGDVEVKVGLSIDIRLEDGKRMRIVCLRFLRLAAYLGALGVAMVPMGVGAEAAAGESPEQAIAYLNQQRAAYAIPPVTLDQSLLKSECNLGNHEIASPITTWSVTRSPWPEAPYHEQILYDPTDVAGSYGEFAHFGSERSTGPWACMWFRHDYGTGPARFYWAAEASGPNAVPPSVEAYEAPSTPSEDLGLKDPTGPNISLYALGSEHLDAVSATVVGPSGQVAPSHLIGSFGGAMLVIDRPVAEKTTYNVTVVWRGYRYAGPEQGEVPEDQAQSFAFTTGFIPKEVDPFLKLTNGGRVGKRVRVWIASGEMLRGRRVEVSVAILKRHCGKQRTPPRPGCGYGTSRRRVRKVVLSQSKVAILVPRPTARRKLHIRVTSKQFRYEEGVIRGKNANLELRRPRKHRR